MSRLSTVWNYYHQYGLRALIWRIHRRRKFVILTRYLTDVSEPPMYDDMVFRLAGPADVAALGDLLSTSWGVRREEDIRQRLSSGDLAIVAIDRNTGQIGCVTWVSRNDPLFHTHFGATPQETEACSRKLYVSEPFRRRGLAARAILHAEWAARQAGYQRLWAYILQSNLPSLGLHAKLGGYERYGTLRLGRLWGRRFAEVRRPGEWSWSRLEPVTADGAEHEIPQQEAG